VTRDDLIDTLTRAGYRLRRRTVAVKNDEREV
jgi:hypothetical protein